MASVFGWYGPLIDLSAASFHIGDFVQLLVFVHRSFPCKSSKRGRDLTRTDIEVGDETTPHFVVSLWQKHMASAVAAGDVVLLQNLKIAKYGGVVEARTVQWSSLLRLVYPYHSLLSKGLLRAFLFMIVGFFTHLANWTVNAFSESELLDEDWTSNQNFDYKQYPSCRRVDNRLPCWDNNKGQAQEGHRVGAAVSVHHLQHQQIELLPRNWTLLEEEKLRDCFSLIEVSQLMTSCKAIVCASIGEIVPLHTSRALGNTKKENIFISRKVCRAEDNNLVDDLICTGCHLCGSPLDSKFEKNAVPLMCWKSSSRLHSICLIYRPFMLYIWDESDYMPVIVKNRAAEILFGNIKAGKVYSTYKEQMHNQDLGPRAKCKYKFAGERLAINPGLSKEGLPSANTLDVSRSLQLEQNPPKFNFYGVWLILLKMLLKQGKNGPLKFEIIVDPSLDIENGKFEMVSATVPCFGIK
ncbi:hypothetical protein Fmac_031651 [Flemingia macrophylla]|uniref:Uncharacterized protein n=1 Tax=Flemingia macrophylla TaxID=520843 RepID=A0ABD1L2P0_9FABA